MNSALKEMKSDVQKSEIDFVACPTSLDSSSDESLTQVGPYNPLHLAGQALSLAESLSPGYMQVYVSSLEDFSALKRLKKSKKS